MKPLLCLCVLMAAALSSAENVMNRTPSGPFLLSYKLTELDPASHRPIATGTYLVSENSGDIYIESTIDGELSQLRYTAGRSLVVRQPVSHESDYLAKHASIYSEGFQSLSTDLPLFLPFQYKCLPIYEPIASYQAFLTRVKTTTPPWLYRIASDLGQSNVSFNFAPSKSSNSMGAGSFQSSKDHETLTVGVPHQKLFEYDYSDYTQIAGVKVPRSITMTTYSSGVDSHTYAPLATKVLKRYRFQLVKFGDTEKSVAAPSEAKILKPGMWISYNGPSGKGAGVLYSPEKGSLDQQLGLQLAMKRTVIPQAKAPSSLPVVPLVSSVVFGVLAFRFLGLGKRRPMVPKS